MILCVVDKEKVERFLGWRLAKISMGFVLQVFFDNLLTKLPLKL